MVTQKWHALEHLCDAVSLVGGVEGLHVGVHMVSYKQFKASYALSSQRKRSAMDEVFACSTVKTLDPAIRFSILIV